MNQLQEAFGKIRQHASASQLSPIQTQEAHQQIAQLQARYQQLEVIAAEMQKQGARRSDLSEPQRSESAGNQSSSSQWSET